MTPPGAATRPVRLFMIAGEPSGDALGGRLLAALKRQSGGALEVAGIGGPAMAGQGLTSLFPMAELSLLGIFEVLPKAARVLARVRETAAAIRAARPDLVVTIDAPAFAFRVGHKILGSGIAQLHVVAPTVWAWRPRRAAMVARFLRHLLCLFPFEPPYFERHGLAATFIGHPVVEDAPGAADLDAAAVALAGRLGLVPGRPVLVVLPGSRRGEVSRLAGPFGAALGLLAERLPGLAVVVPTVPNVAALVRAAVGAWPVPVHVLDDPADKLPAMRLGRAALAASGTVALELALTATPMVVAYRTAPLSAVIFRLMVKVRFANLINLLLDRAVVPELLQRDCSPAKLAAAVLPLLADGDARDSQIRAMDTVMTMLGRGGEAPSDRAARVILSLCHPKE